MGARDYPHDEEGTAWLERVWCCSKFLLGELAVPVN